MNALDDSAITDLCMLYEDSANFLKGERFMKNIRPYKPLKDERRGHKNHHELVRQSEAKLKQAPQSEANVCRRRVRKKMKSQKNLPY